MDAKELVKELLEGIQRDVDEGKLIPRACDKCCCYWFDVPNSEPFNHVCEVEE